MPDTGSSRRVEITQDGHAVASAELHPAAAGSDPRVLRTELHVEAGQLPAGTRDSLVDAVLDSPEAADAEHVSATAPHGEDALLSRMRDRTDSLQARAVGSTTLIDADLPAHPAP